MHERAGRGCCILCLLRDNAVKLFSRAEPQSTEDATMALERAHEMFGFLERLADSQGHWLASSRDHPLMVDSVLISTVQFALNVYCVKLCRAHRRLATVVKSFEARESAALDKIACKRARAGVANGCALTRVQGKVVRAAPEKRQGRLSKSCHKVPACYSSAGVSTTFDAPLPCKSLCSPLVDPLSLLSEPRGSGAFVAGLASGS